MKGFRANVRSERDRAGEAARDYIAKVQFCVDFMHNNGMLEDGSFTFPDGDTFWATSAKTHR